MASFRDLIIMYVLFCLIIITDVLMYKLKCYLGDIWEPNNEEAYHKTGYMIYVLTTGLQDIPKITFLLIH